MKIAKIISDFLSPKSLSSNSKEAWHYVISKEDIEVFFESSKEKLQIVFKHSSSCGISFFAMKSLNIPEILENENINLHLIDVIQQRSISQDFAEKVNIRHESPQIFIIKDGAVTWHGSHNSVNAGNVLKNI